MNLSLTKFNTWLNRPTPVLVRDIFKIKKNG